METRAPHMIVGLFVISLLLAGVGFGTWVANVDIDAEYKEYDIFMEGSVLGLYEQGTVFYLGIPVGKVLEIALAPDDPRMVQVTVQVRAEVPVNEGSRAVLELQALTGITNIQIFGGPPDAKELVIQEGQLRPVIPAEPSPLQEFFTQTPNLINELLLTVGRIREVFNEKNMKNISEILENANGISQNLNVGTKDLAKVVREARETMDSVKKTAEDFSKLAASGEALLTADGKQIVKEFSETLASARKIFDNVDSLIAANEGAITSFANSTLVEVTRLVMDLRKASQSLNRLMSRIESDPVGLLKGKNQSEYQPATNNE